jgi:hypothetical protein
MQEDQRRAAKGQLIALMQAGHPWHEAAAMAGVHIGRSEGRTGKFQAPHWHVSGPVLS